MHTSLRALAMAAATLLPASTASAQLSATTDLGAFSRYEWRGLSFTNRPVAQPDLYLTLARGATAYTLGAWANVELAGYDGPRDISVTAGLDGASATAWTVWGETARTLGRTTVAAGVNVYAYPTTNGIAAAYNSTEPYARVTVAAPLNPRVTVFHDIGSIRGTYVEGAISQGVGVGGARVLTLGAVAGWSAGQAERAGSGETAYFERDGLTSVDLSGALALPVGAVTFTPSVHLTVLRDAYTRVTAPGESHGVKLWVGTSVSFSRVIAR